MHGASCRQKTHRNGSVTSDHQMVGAAILPPDGRAVIPLRPEPIVKHDGSRQTAGERHAAQRCLAKLRQDHPPLQCIVTADRRSAHAPHIETLHDDGCHAILGVKDGDPPSWCKQVQVAEQAGRVTDEARHDRAAEVVPRCRFVNDVPLNASRADVRVHCME